MLELDAHGCRLSAWGRSLSCPRLQVRAAVLRSGAMSAKVQQASQAREPQVAAAAHVSVEGGDTGRTWTAVHVS